MLLFINLSNASISLYNSNVYGTTCKYQILCKCTTSTFMHSYSWFVRIMSILACSLLCILQVYLLRLLLAAHVKIICFNCLNRTTHSSCLLEHSYKLCIHLRLKLSIAYYTLILCTKLSVNKIAYTVELLISLQLNGQWKCMIKMQHSYTHPLHSNSCNSVNTASRICLCFIHSSDTKSYKFLKNKILLMFISAFEYTNKTILCQ